MGLLKKRRKAKAIMGKENKKSLHKNLEFVAVEQYKLLRTNLEFTLADEDKCHVIGITSPTRGEGKSTTSINLSYVLAEKGSRVLLIDGDLRRPSIAKKMDIEPTPGLTDLLMGKGAQISDFQSELLKKWFIMPSGEIPPNPSELLGSRRMKNIIENLKENFDYIIIDMPPVNIVSDAISISNCISGMVVVVREDFTEKKELKSCFRQLKLSNINILGCVLNDFDHNTAAHKKYNKKYLNY